MLNRNWKSKKELQFVHDEKLVKNIVNEFKKFARQHKFWEDYKRFSNPLKDGMTFYTVVDSNEPVKLIQNANAFCRWSDNACMLRHDWQHFSDMWADICLKNNFYYDKEYALNYVSHVMSFKFYKDKVIY